MAMSWHAGEDPGLGTGSSRGPETLDRGLWKPRVYSISNGAQLLAGV
jgi:hypothetical protein